MHERVSVDVLFVIALGLPVKAVEHSGDYPAQKQPG